MPSWGSGVCTCFNQLKMSCLQLWFKMHCASWNASRCSLSISSHLPPKTLSSIQTCCPRYGASIVSAPKPVWWEGAPQRKGPWSLEILSCWSTHLSSSTIFWPILVLVWGICIHSPQQHGLEKRVPSQACRPIKKPCIPSSTVALAKQLELFRILAQTWHKAI